MLKAKRVKLILALSLSALVLLGGGLLVWKTHFATYHPFHWELEEVFSITVKDMNWNSCTYRDPEDVEKILAIINGFPCQSTEIISPLAGQSYTLSIWVRNQDEKSMLTFGPSWFRARNGEAFESIIYWGPEGCLNELFKYAPGGKYAPMED